MSIPLPLPDKPGQGELYAQVHELSNAFVDATNRGDKHEAGCVERKLATARSKFHALHGKQVRPPEE